jgi:hypothetical protein
MEQNENYIDMIINSLKYSVSDMGALFWGGIAALFGMILVGLPFLFGYITRCGREILNGNGKLPTWDRLGEKFTDGLMIAVVMIVFGLISAILYVFIVPFFVIGIITANGVLIVAALLMLIPAIVINITLSLLLPAAWVEYALTGDLVKALNPINALRLAARNPTAYAGAVVASIVLQIVLSVPSVLVVTVPWTTFAMYTSSAYVYAWFYRQTTGAVPTTMSGGPSVAAAV